MQDLCVESVGRLIPPIFVWSGVFFLFVLAFVCLLI